MGALAALRDQGVARGSGDPPHICLAEIWGAGYDSDYIDAWRQPGDEVFSMVRRKSACATNGRGGTITSQVFPLTR